MVKEWMCALCGAKFDHECPDGCENCGAPCVDCGVWKDHAQQRQQYGKWCCEECGEPLEIWLDKLEEERLAEGDGSRYERRHLMWHCTKCGCDYENYWETQWGDTMESKPQRKYWG